MAVENEVVDVAPFIDEAWVEGPSSVQTHGPEDVAVLEPGHALDVPTPCDGRPGAMLCRMRMSDCCALTSANSEMIRNNKHHLHASIVILTVFIIYLYVHKSIAIRMSKLAYCAGAENSYHYSSVRLANQR